MIKMFEDFEFNWTVLGLTVILSAIFIAIIWGMSTWESYPIKNKIMITIALPVVSYFIISYRLNN